MKVWLAGVPGGGTTGDCKRERELNKFWNLRLWSYYHFIESNGKMKRTKTNEKKVDLFLDSGAFSALTQGVEIDIQEYIKFIKEHEDVIDIYANLDVIGSAEGTWKNQMIMEKAGLNPMPVYHYGEDVKWLKRYLKRGYDYIALGGLVGASSSALKSWLDPIWKDYLTTDDGMPIIKVHGFGLTSLTLMKRYPWYSVDSTSWVVTGRMGSIMIPLPNHSNGGWDYMKNPLKVDVSSQSPHSVSEMKKNSPNARDAKPIHITNLKPVAVREYALKYIEEKGYKLGKSEFRMESQAYELKENEKWADKKPKDKKTKRRLEVIIEPGISNKYQLRDEMNILYFLDLEKALPKWPWSFKEKIKENQQRMF